MTSNRPEHPLAVARSGLPSGGDHPTFLLLHGYAGSRFSWRHWMARLEARGSVVAVDLKGFGAADRPDDGAYGPHDQAALVHALIRREGLERLTLVGHSLGGGIALLAALRLRDEAAGGLGDSPLRRLVLLSAAAYPQKLPPLVHLSRWPGLSTTGMRLLGMETIVRWTLRSIVHDPDGVTEEQVRGYAGPLEDETAQRALLDVGARIVPPDLAAVTARYPEIDVPTLLLWGDSDRVVPASVGRQLHRALPDSRLEVLDRCGHLPAEEHPEASWARVAAFLDAT